MHEAISSYKVFKPMATSEASNSIKTAPVKGYYFSLKWTTATRLMALFGLVI